MRLSNSDFRNLAITEANQASKPLKSQTKFTTKTCVSLKATLATRDNGTRSRTSRTDGEFRSGRMDPCTKASGKMTRLTERGDSFTAQEMYTKGSGRTTWLMEKGSTGLQTERSMTETGRMMKKMELAWRSGRTELAMRESTQKE